MAAPLPSILCNYFSTPTHCDKFPPPFVVGYASEGGEVMFKGKDKLKLVRLPVDRILPNPSQPRKTFDRDELVSLAQSIRENGLLQPVTVRRDTDGAYLLVAGERRLRAAKLAGLKEIPALLTDCDRENSAVLALLENLQRQDLNVFEEAHALLGLLREWSITQEEAARRLGMSQSTLANKLRLLKLTPEEQEVILEYHLTERHARALLKVEDVIRRRQVLETVVKRGLNVAQTEALIAGGVPERVPLPRGKRTFVAKDVRLFLNTIDHAVATMQTAGIPALAERTETEDYFQCTVRIPKQAGAPIKQRTR